MSATIPNLDQLAAWLGAQAFVADFRPVPLVEYVTVGDCVYDRKMEVTRKLQSSGKREDSALAALCCEVSWI